MHTKIKMNAPLRMILRLNALSCLGFGIAFAVVPELIGDFLDGVRPGILRWVGIGLCVNGLHLVAASSRDSIGRTELGYFILGDFLWVIASLWLITLVPDVIYTLPAVGTTTTIAVVVGTFAVLQTRWGWNKV